MTIKIEQDCLFVEKVCSHPIYRDADEVLGNLEDPEMFEPIGLSINGLVFGSHFSGSKYFGTNWIIASRPITACSKGETLQNAETWEDFGAALARG